MTEETAGKVTDTLKGSMDSVEGLVWGGGGGNVLFVSFVHQGRLTNDEHRELRELAEDNGLTYSSHETYHDDVMRVVFGDAPDVEQQ